MRPLQKTIGLGFTLAGWTVFLLLLAWLARGFLDRGESPNRDVHPTRTDGGVLEVVLRRNRSGHYVAPGFINGRKVEFLVDTGATLVALDQRLGRRLGLEGGAAWTVQTANGTVTGRRTLIASVDVAGIRQQSVPAIMLPDLGDQVLLGMSFLKRVELVQRDGTLTLRSGE